MKQSEAAKIANINNNENAHVTQNADSTNEIEKYVVQNRRMI